MDRLVLLNRTDEICRRIKNLYFAEQEWNMTLAKTIATKLTKLKALSKTYYPGEDIVDVLHKIAQFSDDDFREMIDLTTHS